jgi:PAS domain S-box-containing protein
LELEEQARRNYPGFKFFTRDLAGSQLPFAPEDRFFPVYFVEPLSGNEVSLGYSASQVATRQLALRQALETREISASGPMKLIQEGGDQLGFLVMVPVLGPDGHPRGVVQGVFRAGDLVRKSLAFLEPKGITVNLRSRFQGETDAFLHAEPSPLKAFGGSGSGLHLERSFEMAGRLWTVQALAEAGHFPLGPGWRAWSILGGGFAITFLLAGFLRTVLDRAAEVKSLVVARTLELQQETERHLQDAVALRESEARYRHLVDAMDEGMWILAPSGRTLFLNRRMADLLGHAVADMADQPFEAFLHESEAPRSQRYLAEWLSGAGIHHDLRFKRKDGTDLWAIVSGTFVAGGGGEPAGILAMVTDVTERRRTEEMQLQSQKLESLGVLAGGIAHDFNNLLAAMLGNLGIAQLSLPQDSKVRAPLDNLEKSIERAAHLTRQMLAYSGKGQFSIAPLDLNQTVQEISHLIAVSMSKKVTLRYDLQPNLPVMTADAAQIQQVVMNLMTNASEAIGDGEGEVTLKTSLKTWLAEDLAPLFPGQALEPGAFLLLEVNDTGMGMSPQVQARIFEPFYTTKFTGRGLGLSSMQGIVRGHGGGIRIDSKVGQGTTFLLAFPVGHLEESREENAPSEEPWRGAGTILLVDDEEDLLRVTARLLQNQGFDVVTARDGRQALDLFQQDPKAYRAVLMDFTMPRMNGLDAFREMQRLDPGCRVILASGYQDLSAISNGEDLPLVGFLRKPFSRKELIQVLRKALEA